MELDRLAAGVVEGANTGSGLLSLGASYHHTSYPRIDSLSILARARQILDAEISPHVQPVSRTPGPQFSSCHGRMLETYMMMPGARDQVGARHQVGARDQVSAPDQTQPRGEVANVLATSGRHCQGFQLAHAVWTSFRWPAQSCWRCASAASAACPESITWYDNFTRTRKHENT